MQAKADQNKRYVIWTLVGLSLGLWIISVSHADFPYLSFVPPLARMGYDFKAGLLIILCIFFIGDNHQRTAAIIIISLYFIATLSFIFDYPIMHDSLNNVTNLALFRKANEGYGRSYAGFPILIGLIHALSGEDAMTIARFFPAGMGFLYLLTLGTIGILWQKSILTSSLSALFMIFFILVFGESFYLRINASPQTFGFLLFLVALALIPLSTRSRWIKIIFLITLFAMIVTHPITPLLALPGLLAVGLFSGKVDKNRLILVGQTIGLFGVGYITWTLYQADWLLSNAVKFIVDALETDKIIPMVGYSITPQPEVDNYLLWHRILLISLIIVLVCAYFILFRTKTWRLITLWGISLLPPFILLFSYRDFFDRVMLFSLVPCAVSFSEAAAKTFYGLPRFKIIVSILLIMLAILSGYVSYFSIGAVDRITQDEIQASQFLASLNKPMRVYSGGFNLPLPPEYNYVSVRRGEIELDKVNLAETVIFSQQMENSVFLNPRSSIRIQDLQAVLQQGFYDAFDSGQVKVFIRKP